LLVEGRGMKSSKSLPAWLFLCLTVIMVVTLVSCTSRTAPVVEKTTAPATKETTTSEPEEEPASEPEEPTASVPEEKPAPKPEEPTASVPGKTATPVSEKTLPASAVSLADKGNYYEVVLDFTNGKSPCEVMQEYGQVLSDELPDIQADIDQFLYDLIDSGLEMYTEDLGIEIPFGLRNLAVGIVGNMLIQRIDDVKSQIPGDYVEELEGLASTLVDTGTDSIGDGRLSTNELYFFHLMGDIARTVQCSAIGVFGGLSATGSTIVGRNFDLEAHLKEYNSVTRINKGEDSIYLIGWLANLTGFTGFNNDGIFGAIVDTTGSGEPYLSAGKYSYAFDLRYALENETTLDGVADYMSTHPYAFNHLVFLADPVTSGVLENNISGTGPNMRRELRTTDSVLNPGIQWEYDNVIVAVSAFMLNGNHDNFTDEIVATSRLQSYKILIAEAATDSKLDWEDIRSIQSYDGVDGVPGEMEEGDLYNVGTRRIVVFQPETFKLEVWFSQTETPEDDPATFDRIPVSFD